MVINMFNLYIIYCYFTMCIVQEHLLVGQSRCLRNSCLSAFFANLCQALTNFARWLDRPEMFWLGSSALCNDVFWWFDKFIDFCNMYVWR